MLMTVEVAVVRTTARDGHPPPHGRFGAYLTIAPRAIASEGSDWRPVRHSRRRACRIKRREGSRAIDDFPADDGEFRCRVRDVAFGTREVVTVRNDEVREVPYLDPSLLALFVGEPRHVLR